ncbi:hypothetical protein E2320_017146, partial [Naja naja]
MTQWGDLRKPYFIVGFEAKTEFRAELLNAGSKLIVIDFSATWCGPCKMMKPFFHSMVDKYPDVVFIEIDVDDAQDVATHCDVKCMPTFQFYKNNEKETREEWTEN